MLEASLFGLSTVQGLVVLFVLLPIVAGAVIVPVVSWRISSSGPQPVRTSEILATGVPVTAQIVSVKTLGSILEMRPMVRFVIRVSPAEGCEGGETAQIEVLSGRAGGEPFDLEVVQSLPRAVIANFRSGDIVHAKLTPDFAAGAIVWESWP